MIADDRADVFDTMGAAPYNCPTASQDLTDVCSEAWALANGPTCAQLCLSMMMPCLEGDTCHTGGTVVLVIFSVLVGGMGLGQAAPSFSAVSAGQVTGHKVFKVIDNVVKINAAASACVGSLACSVGHAPDHDG